MYMKSQLLLLIFILSTASLLAQPGQDTTWRKLYRESYPKVNDLVHTRLEAKFDYAKSYLYGKVSITLKPHVYATDSLQLDAKGMDIAKVAIVKGASMKDLKYKYDGWLLKIKLDKTYKGGESYTVFVDYTAKPNEIKVHGSDAITDAKGLYFINPKGEDKDKPTQIWTQGETEGTSVWCPIIDKPNQKTTDEIIMTVPDKYVTLSNGKLVSQKKNADGTRTDDWKMELPHSPYLFFMGVGEYSIIKDKYKGKEVSYYVEKEYAPVARKIFGLTPAMIAFYEKITGVAYPWVKYSQITGRDYVSGAMENTTCTLHAENAQQDARELVDGNDWESVIAHELFHQWFGDYVTCESWSNLTVNESFADYSQYLWKEHQYGAEAAAEENYNEMRQYLGNPAEAEKDLVRFYYADKENMFDLVSYQKGGRILNMLRNVVGDSAFFKGLNLYLTTNKFKNGEAHQLRLALEETGGKDLNWFFNQWYFGNGHPKVTVDYAYDEAAKKVSVTIRQIQSADNIFKIPLTIDVYNGANKVSHEVWINKAVETFTFSYTTKPDLVNVDAAKAVLWDKTDNKTFENFMHQYTYGNYVDRREAIAACIRQQNNPAAIDHLKVALKDKYYGLRIYTMDRLDFKIDALRQAVEPVLADLAKSEKKPTVKAKAIELLANYKKNEYKELFTANLKDSSYSIAGAALKGLSLLDSAAGLAEAKKQMSFKTKGRLADVVSGLLIEYGTEEDFDFIANRYGDLPLGQSKFEATASFGNYLGKVKSTEKLKKGVDLIVAFRESIPQAYRGQTDGPINGMILGGLKAKKENDGLKEQAEYIGSKLP
jgi:aminopeptidase N